MLEFRKFCLGNPNEKPLCITGTGFHCLHQSAC
jgi:hypothetical protein